MPSLVIKQLPEELHRKLKEQAARHHRSITREAIALLERALDEEVREPPAPCEGNFPLTDALINEAKREGRVIVVDTSIVAYSLLEGERTTQSRALWRADPEWRLPVFWQYEFLNVLTTFSRRGGMERIRANRLWSAARQWCRPMERAVDGAAVLQFAIEQNASAYDAQFVVLAQSLGTRLVSEDARLRRQCTETVLSMTDYLAH